MRNVTARLVVGGNLLFVGDILREHEPTLAALEYVERFAGCKVVLAGEALARAVAAAHWAFVVGYYIHFFLLVACEKTQSS